MTFRSRILLSILVLACPALAAAQGDGPRTYLYLPEGQNLVIPWYMNLKGSLDPTGSIQLPDAEVEVDLFLVNYHRTFGLAGRYALFQAVVPAGKVSGEVRLGDRSFESRESSGLGDIGLITTVNLAGAPALAPKDYATHPFRASIHATAGVFLPTGEYDPERLLNLGTNRTAFKLGFPVNVALGKWIFGQRTVIDVNPFVYLFTANSDLAVGDSKGQDPLWTVEAHLSRDLGKKVWVSLDSRYFNGGETSVDDVPDDNSVEALSLGGSFGWALSKHMSVQATYSERVASKTEDFEARMIRFRFAYAF